MAKKEIEVPWIRVDATFITDDHYLALPEPVRNDAYLLLLAITGQCRLRLIDGVMPLVSAEAIAQRMGIADPAPSLAALVSGPVRLLQVRGKNVVVPKYSKWQDTKAEVIELRERRAEAGRIGGKRTQELRSKPEADASSKPQAADGSKIKLEKRREEESREENKEPSVSPPRGRTQEWALVADRIFTAWQQATSHPTAKLGQKRRNKIYSRLKEGWSEDHLVLAVTTGVLNDPWPDRRVNLNDDIWHILKTSETTEKFVELAAKPRGLVVVPTPGKYDHVNDGALTVEVGGHV